jgi:hypothetical protein
VLHRVRGHAQNRTAVVGLDQRPTLPRVVRRGLALWALPTFARIMPGWTLVASASVPVTPGALPQGFAVLSASRSQNSSLILMVSATISRSAM